MFNGNISLSIFGESHGAGIGVVIDNLPAGEAIDLDEIQQFLNRRAPGNSDTATARKEGDIPEILSGLYNGKTTGTPLCAVIRNTNQISSDYENIAALRLGHADYTGHVRYKGSNDIRGGGHFSGRLTAPLVFAGAVCGQILKRRGISVNAEILSIGGVKVTGDEQVREIILSAKSKGDSVGGVIKCTATGVPAGIGSPMLDGLENVISRLVFAIPAVKGIEFGTVCDYGSENNDEFYLDGDAVKTRTNNHGGILGGISSGMPIEFTVKIKPTPSISIPQNTVDIAKMQETVMEIKGRHDPCIVPRAVVCVEAAMNIALLSLME